MSTDPETRLHELIARHQLGEISEEEQAELEAALRESPEARTLFRRACRLEGELVRLAESAEGEAPGDKTVLDFPASRRRRISWLDVGLAAAVVVLLGILLTSRLGRPETIATLVSAEDAAWESALPTLPGSSLTEGELKLVSGLATVRFHSGAEMVLEAPARVRLESPMKAHLLAGVAVVNVPEEAIGFVLDAPGAYAVDHGTQFAVHVSPTGDGARFDVLEGEISVHEHGSGREVRLTDREGASVSGGEMTTFENLQDEPALADGVRRVRVGTEGQSDYVNRRNKRGRHIHPEFLMVKSTESRLWDMRAFFRINFSAIDLASVESARLRLNQVPSGQGLASRLPLRNTFAVYGVTRPDKEEWTVDPTWEDGPDVDDGILLGRFDIPRSQQDGSVTIGGQALLDFLQSDSDQRVTFVVVRETGLIDGKGKGLFHAFASDRHPESSGPTLEFVMREE